MERVPNLIKSAARLQEVLKAAGTDSIVIGGLAVSFWGDPRATRDVDFKVLVQRDDADRLIGSLPPDYRLLSPEPKQTLTRLGFLFAEDEGGIRLDLLLAETNFDVEAVRRGLRLIVGSADVVTVCTPEDLIVYKMISTRVRDHDDVQGIVRRQGKKLDDDYIISWLREFEEALDDSTLVESYRQMSGAPPDDTRP
ncbi:MAG TPA: hypothetical protein VFV34_24350 [Blastocatellia bacterium]|nr:hypothetical protein [Blastocatellia bacterium]